MTQSDNAPVEITPPKVILILQYGLGSILRCALSFKLCRERKSLQKVNSEAFYSLIVMHQIIYAFYHAASHGLFQSHVYRVAAYLLPMQFQFDQMTFPVTG
jgi:hypothetical protein